MFFNKIAQFYVLVSLIHKLFCRVSARVEQFSADQSPEAPTSDIYVVRRQWDSNPRAFYRLWFSRPAHSSALPYLRTALGIILEKIRRDRTTFAPSAFFGMLLRQLLLGGGELPPVSLRSPGLGTRLETPPRQRVPPRTAPSLAPRRDLTTACAP